MSLKRHAGSLQNQNIIPCFNYLELFSGGVAWLESRLPYRSRSCVESNLMLIQKMSHEPQEFPVERLIKDEKGEEVALLLMRNLYVDPKSGQITLPTENGLPKQDLYVTDFMMLCMNGEAPEYDVSWHSRANSSPITMMAQRVLSLSLRIANTHK